MDFCREGPSPEKGKTVQRSKGVSVSVCVCREGGVGVGGAQSAIIISHGKWRRFQSRRIARVAARELQNHKEKKSRYGVEAKPCLRRTSTRTNNVAERRRSL